MIYGDKHVIIMVTRMLLWYLHWVYYKNNIQIIIQVQKCKVPTQKY